jgi:hypothetical protein
MRINRVHFVIFIAFVLASQTGISIRARSFENPSMSGFQSQPPNVEFMTAADLKTKVAQKQPVTIIDVRTTESFADSNRKIKGAVHMKLRRLSYRLGFAPLNTVSRDSKSYKAQVSNGYVFLKADGGSG